MGYPTLRGLPGKMRPRLTGLPYLGDRETHLGGLPHLSCKHDQINVRDYMERRVTSSRQVTSPTWGPPPPFKQALRSVRRCFLLTFTLITCRSFIILNFIYARKVNQIQVQSNLSDSGNAPLSAYFERKTQKYAAFHIGRKQT